MTRIRSKIVYPELSFQITGLLFEVHNDLGRYCREKQYADAIESALKSSGIAFEREKELPVSL
jgi:GxxExxY protein